MNIELNNIIIEKTRRFLYSKLVSMSSSNTPGLTTSSSVGWVCDTPRMRVRLHMRTQGKRQTQRLKRILRMWKIRSWASLGVEASRWTNGRSRRQAGHLLKAKNPTGKPAIIVRCVNRKSKVNILKNGRLKGTNVYVNECCGDTQGAAELSAAGIRKGPQS